MKRCEWATAEPAIGYHDTEWGVPQHDDTVLFEFLVLEGAQAGLSWNTILRKRANFRTAFDNFDPEVVARYDEGKISRLLTDPGIVRNRLKIRAAVRNARAFCEVRQEFGSFDAYLWRFVDGSPKINHWRSLAEIPSRSPQGDALSKDLVQRGFTFVGPTICYSFMQAVGLVNDHVIECFRYKEIQAIP